MRDAFHEQLDSITAQLVDMTRLAGSAMARATTALLDADLHLAEDVITGDRTAADGCRARAAVIAGGRGIGLTVGFAVYTGA